MLEALSQSPVDNWRALTGGTMTPEQIFEVLKKVDKVEILQNFKKIKDSYRCFDAKVFNIYGKNSWQNKMIEL